MTRKLLLLASALSLFAVTPVWAGMITFNFADCTSITTSIPGSCPGDLGTYKATFNDTYNVTAYGENLGSGLSHRDLYVKQAGSTETGLGLAQTTNDEVNADQAIFLDMSDLIAHGIYSGTVSLGSLQSGEYGTVCIGTLNAGPFSNCHDVYESGTSQIGWRSVTWSTADPYLVFEGPKSSWEWCGTSSGNFLLDSLTVNNNVPEPGSLALFAIGLAGLGWAIASRRRALGR